MALARALLLILLTCGLAGVPAYEIYASTNCRALEAIANEAEEAVLGESVSKLLPGRLDMLRVPTGSTLVLGLLGTQRRPLPPSTYPLILPPLFHVNLHHVLQKFRI